MESEVSVTPIEKDYHSKIIHHPYSEAVRDEFVAMFPEQKQVMDLIINTIDRQAVDNFQIFSSQAFPDVRFGYTTFDITPELIHKIVNTSNNNNMDLSPQNQTEKSLSRHNRPKHDLTFIFPAFTQPDEALSGIDIAINDFIRALPRVANPLRNGEEVPNVKLILLSTPSGFGGHLTKEWLNVLDQKGFDAYGQLFSEFVQKIAAEQASSLDEIAVTLHGVSRGTILADRTISRLPQDLKKHTQILLDNPAGVHNPKGVSGKIKSAQLLAGLVGEFVVTSIKTNVAKRVMKESSAFKNTLRSKMQLPSDSREQKIMKIAAVASEGLHLLHGTPLDVDNNRLHIRESMKDPLTTGFTRLKTVFDKVRERKAIKEEGKRLIAIDEGRSTHYPTKHGFHFWIYRHYEKWNEIIKTIQQKNNPTTSPQKV
ncbi:MAG: hypothetical protein KatS3mg089_0483 [Patescibacteria group bacterium]|nr:MAG: hypothetical protein KatS3mg089_0483 [Patescibacteria group bacterium]